MKIREYLSKLRSELDQMFKYSLDDAANFNGLAIEPFEDMPPTYTGHLDTYDNPRFIGVNADLPEHERKYVKARELGRYFQRLRRDSIVINRPWKWNLLATAPTETRDFIMSLDIEWRAYWLMYWHAGKKDFFGFIKRYPKKYFAVLFADNISNFVFWKLRVQTLIFKFFYKLALYDN
jgi:hypothetical protein